ncbi:MAG TPA: hypothetical protein VK580_17085 [Steroidobacteraceae bacterium]|nr:hypothetical protein [Steroidobacteraceae bacterium]
MVSTLQYLQGFAERFNSFDELVVNGIRCSGASREGVATWSTVETRSSEFTTVVT